MKKSNVDIKVLLGLTVFLIAFSLIFYFFKDASDVLKFILNFLFVFGAIFVYQKLSEQKDYEFTEILTLIFISFILSALLGGVISSILGSLGENIVELIKGKFTAGNIISLALLMLRLLSVILLFFGFFLIITNLIMLFNLKKGVNLSTEEEIKEMVEEIEVLVENIRVFFYNHQRVVFKVLVTNLNSVFRKMTELRNKI